MRNSEKSASAKTAVPGAWWLQPLSSLPHPIVFNLCNTDYVYTSATDHEVTISLAGGLLLAGNAASQARSVDLKTLVATTWSALISRLAGADSLLIQARISSQSSYLHFVSLNNCLVIDGLNQATAQIDQWHVHAAEQAARFTDPQLAAELNSRANIGFVWIDSTEAITSVPLQLIVKTNDNGGDLQLCFRANAQTASQDGLQRLAEQFQALLQSLIENLNNEQDQQIAIDQLVMMPSAQREQLLLAFNQTQKEFDRSQCLHHLFEHFAAITPNANALVAESQALTYAELNAQANQLARWLQQQGIGPDQRVAICLSRGVSMIIAALAVFKAGGAYVPMDPSYPLDRLSFMLQDSAPRVIITEAALINMIKSSAKDALIIDYSAQQSYWQSQSIDNLSVGQFGLMPQHLAYLVYTSGSTGKPKGVMVTHAGAVNFAYALREHSRADNHSRVLQFASFSFDASVLEIWMAYAAGAALYMLPSGDPLAGDGLLDLIDAQKITHAILPPAVLTMLTPDRRVDSLQTLFSGGDALSETVAARWASNRRLINAYGPSEITVAATMHDCLTQIKGAPPIGKPIANTCIYILDSYLQPVPIGANGEIYIGGTGLARGYWNRDELTAERFIDNPFFEDSRCDQQCTVSEKIYSTGDLGRWREDGSIEFLGRNDFQVKIRGFRIELGEIESRLRAHAGVRDAVVIASHDNAGEKQLIAYVLADENTETAQQLSVAKLRDFVGEQLPEFMVPSWFVLMDAFPISPNGKVDRKALPAPGNARPELDVSYAEPIGAIETMIVSVFESLLGVRPVGRDDGFFAVGGNSLLAIRALDQISKKLPEPHSPRLSATLIFRHPTPAGLAAVLTGHDQKVIDSKRLSRGAAAAQNNTSSKQPIAIIAASGRFPGADNIEVFWANLLAGKDSISEFTIDELDPSISPSLCADPAYVKARGVIEGVEDFDAAFFGISPREAEMMDPQHRLFLELSWECIERAGYAPERIDGPVGVFAGCYSNTYYQKHILAHPERAEQLGWLQVTINNEKDFIATRVAHKLNLTGPAISVHTACSTSLVAVVQAVAALRAGQCDMALAGGASVTCPPRSGYLYQEGAMLSPDGRTRSFSADAKGTVFSDGAAAVLLKRLADAQADGDPIIAVIRGAAINNDGADKASFTAPSVEGQAAVIAMAHADADIDPRTIGYIEAHGTATPMGDPIEIEGLSKAFAQRTSDNGFCKIGSVKSNVGHLVAAAGAAGLIKTALALRDNIIPASLHFSAANPTIDFANTPFIVNDQASSWPQTETPRRAGVSSFGVGGTNAHVVIEQPPAIAASMPSQGPQLLLLSARSPAALQQSVTRLADHLQNNPQLSLADVAWTLAAGRRGFAHRIAVVAEDVGTAVSALTAPDITSAISKTRPARERQIAFMFPGQGAQYPQMGQALYTAEPVFREAIDRCAQLLATHVDFDLKEKLFSDDPQALRPTAVMQPATFAIEYALAQLWLSQGLQPSALIGHSVGEFVAATLAGIFVLEDALMLVAKRGALMQAMPAGSMLSIKQAASDVLARLPAELSLAAENAPNACVVAGPTLAIEAFAAVLTAESIACRVLDTSHAFHSVMMDPVVAKFHEQVASVPRKPPTIRIISTANAQTLQADQATSANYWARHLREPVLFSKALQTLLTSEQESNHWALLEVGPRTTLSTLARPHMAATKSHVDAIASLADTPAAELTAFYRAVGKLWACGVSIDPAQLDRRAHRQRLCLPTYPFERRRYWLDAAPHANNVASVTPLRTAVNESISTTLSNVSLVTASSFSDPSILEPAMPAAPAIRAENNNRRPALIVQLKELFEDAVGFDLSDADENTHFMELGLDSLTLTQASAQLQKTFAVKIAFRQLMDECATLASLAAYLDERMPADPAATPVVSPAVAAPMPVTQLPAISVAPMALPAAVTVQPMIQPNAVMPNADAGMLQQIIAQQMQIMSQQLALLSGGMISAPIQPPAAMPAVQAATQTVAPVAAKPAVAPVTDTSIKAASMKETATTQATDEENSGAVQIRYDVKKAFGAIARIDTHAMELSARQSTFLKDFIERYNSRTAKSKAYTQQHRAHMADPRVVSGFRPLLKEIVYQIVIDRSRGARVWDIDGNEYIDVINGFGMSLFGWQPQFITDAVRKQLDDGYEIGPQHPLSGEVAKLICEMTGADRAALCNTGSEAVLGAMRIARTVTGRNTIAIFSGSYHGINDEVIVRGTKKLRAVPGAPGILRNTAENVLVLDYGTPESLEIIRERAHELAAVMIEPIQSRRADFRPVEFLREIRKITEASGTAFIFDEVITGFRSGQGGAQAFYGIQADIATYGKVIGGGMPIGVIAGKRKFMDALDGGHWRFGDDSAPTVGVTYFAGTFVRHPLALAAAKASLDHMKAQGPALQERLNARTEALANELNAFCEQVGAPIRITHYSSLWKTKFLEEHPLQDLLFAFMRVRGIHILDNFPCYFTTAHTEADFQAVIATYKAAVTDLLDGEFIPRQKVTSSNVMDAQHPPVAGARLGREPDGRPAWFVADLNNKAQFVKVSG